MGEGWLRLLLVGMGGFLGASVRYLLGGWLTTRWPTLFPYETLLINVSGSFLLSLFMVVAIGRFALPVEYRHLVVIGFLGSYTTFSTLTFETLELAEQGDLLYAALNVLVSVVLGLLAGYLGLVLGRLV